MNLEIILAFVVGAVVGGIAIAIFLPGFLKSIFRETARGELTEITKDVHDEQDQIERDIVSILKDLNKSVTTAEAAWKTSTESLAREVGDLTKSHTQWAEALSNPGEQGALAEESLKVMLETAGFTKDVNFSLQQTETTDEGKLRPDVYVYTPDSGVIIIDSKAPMKLYREAIEMSDEKQRQKKLKQHAKSVLDHAKALGKKDYTQAVGRKTPDFVIMYMPNVAIYMSAVEQIPNLIEQTARNRVMICPPSLIYAALKTIMLTWQQQKTYENAEDIKEQAVEIHTRLKKFHSFFNKIGVELNRATSAFNDGVGSWERRLEPALRKIEEMGIADSSRQIEKTKVIEERASVPEENDKNDN